MRNENARSQTILLFLALTPFIYGATYADDQAGHEFIRSILIEAAERQEASPERFGISFLDTWTDHKKDVKSAQQEHTLIVEGSKILEEEWQIPLDDDGNVISSAGRRKIRDGRGEIRSGELSRSGPVSVSFDGEFGTAGMGINEQVSYTFANNGAGSSVTQQRRHPILAVTIPTLFELYTVQRLTPEKLMKDFHVEELAGEVENPALRVF